MIFKIVITLLLVGALMGGMGWRFGAGLFSRFKAGLWRPGLATLGMAALVLGLFLGIKGHWFEAALVVLAGGAMALSARQRRRSAGSAAPEPRLMTPAVAASLLGVEVNADRETIRAAYRRLMKIGHPDAGGTQGLAAQLSEAQGVLLAALDRRGQRPSGA